MALDEAADLLEAEHLVEGVVEGPQVGVDLLRQVAGEEAQALAGLHRRAHQQQAPHLIALQGVHGAGNGQVGLAGAGGADAKVDVVAQDGLQVGLLIGPPGADQGALEPHRQFRSGLVTIVEQCLDPGGLELKVDGLGGQHLRVRGDVEALQDLPAGAHRLALADETEEVAAVGDLDAQATLDLAQVAVELAGEVGEAAVVLWRETKVEGFGCR